MQERNHLHIVRSNLPTENEKGKEQKGEKKKINPFRQPTWKTPASKMMMNLRRKLNATMDGKTSMLQYQRTPHTPSFS